MLRSLKDLRGYSILCTDDAIGRVHEFYFDDQFWVIRYLVLDTGTWLPGRRVLISPLALGQPNWESHMLPVSLTKRQVEESPPVSADKPVSRQLEKDLHAYYGWPPYWSATASSIAKDAMELASEKKEKEIADPHLRSSREVIGYNIQATDGEIGHVDDMITEDESWMIRYLVIDTRNWLPGKKVLVSPAWAENINWAERKVDIDLKRDTIKNCPEFDPSEPVNREYEIQLYDYYGRPKYW